MTDALDRLTVALADRYAIERELGAGGMATVYLAEDLKHKRKVALKVLRPELAAVLGADRFVQEITTTASLQHPHILPLFDSGEADSFLYYVMPYIEGETLRAKLDREKQLGIDEAVRITTEVGDALDYAHSHNVIHRDIKPENILLHNGRPMVADFGIALAVSAAAGGRMTETGLSLGTPHYMSPEQATAEKHLTSRSDVYSLGAVLYEMLTGDPPHVGSTAQQIIMKIVTEEPEPVTNARKTVPANVAAAVAKALEKLPADRFENAAGLAGALGDPGFIGTALDAGERAAADTRTRARSALMAMVVMVLGILAAWGWSRGRQPSESSVQYLSIILPDSAPLAFIGEGTLGAGRRAIALLPNGQGLVYAGRGRTANRLYHRDFTGFRVTPITGTDSAFSPFVSPDGQWVGFFVGAELRKVPLEGGSPVRLTSTPETMGAAWADDGRILVTAREGTVLGWVPESGGQIQELPNPQSVRRLRPSILPDGRHALVEIFNIALINVIGVTDLETGRTVALTVSGPIVADSVQIGAAISGMEPRYLPSGHLVYSTPAGLISVAFDPAKHTLEGRPVEVHSGVRSDAAGVHYAIGEDGTLVYAPGADGVVGAFVWVNRDGSVDSLGFAPQWYGTFELSPDGQRLAALVHQSAGSVELWIYDLQRRTQSKVLTNGIPYLPRWWPDGRRIAFTEVLPRPPYSVMSVRQLVESAGERDTLGGGWAISDVAPDTVRAVGVPGLLEGGTWIYPLGSGEDAVAVDTYGGAWGPVFSPDGRWIAYTSNESGQYEVYAIDTDQMGARAKVSLDGGEEPMWLPDGDQLVYRWGQEWLAAEVPAPGSTTFGRPRVIFRGPYVNVAWRSHDISPDGTRHLLVLGPLEETTNRLNVITNWFDEVKRRLEQ